MKIVNVSEFYGGLGDIIWKVYTGDGYVSLDRLKEGEGAVVAVVSHNPFATELFKWHRKRGQLTMLTPPFDAPWTQAHRDAAGIPPISKTVLRGFTPVRFYPAPWDARPLQDLSNMGDYLVFNLTAGAPGRDVPPELARLMAKMALERGFKVVSIGRNYKRALPRPEYVACKERLASVRGAVDLVDRLSVPGTAEAMRGAAGVVACHSAMCMLSWYMRKPNFILWPENARPDFGPERTSYGFGSEYPETRHSEFSAFKPEMFEQFLRLVKNERGKIREDPVDYLQKGGPSPK